jgi:hypothetical protein
MNRKMHEARNSWAVAEKTKDKERRLVLAVERMLWKPVSRKQTVSWT